MKTLKKLNGKGKWRVTADNGNRVATFENKAYAYSYALGFIDAKVEYIFVIDL